MDAPPPDHSLNTLQGEAHLLYAFDIGMAIDLDAVEAQLRPAGGVEGRENIGSGQRTPGYFQFDPPPLRIARHAPGLTLAGRAIEARVECLLFDFGAVSLTYTLSVSGPLEGLVEIADAAYENHRLQTHARSIVDGLAAQIGAAIRKPNTSPLLEDYIIYHTRRVDASPEICITSPHLRQIIARVLRAEPGPVSDQQTCEALSACLSYSPNDLVVVDWNAALIVQDAAPDILTVLEFANVELLEFRFLDNRLDGMLDRCYHQTQRSPNVRPPAGTGDMRRIASLQMDAALLFESVSNALKLLGDQHLARVYKLAAKRFHIADWDQSIQRKLSTLDGIYRKVADDRATRRMEVLEWIIIILIAISIVIPFVTSGK